MDSNSTSDFIRSLFGPTTSHNVFVTSLANEKTGSEDKPRQLVTRDTADITNFVARWDRAGCGLFFCVGTLKPGSSRRAKENISEIIGLHADIDMKSIEVDRAEVVTRLLDQRIKPSVIVDSGGGFHVYYLFNEAIEASCESAGRIEPALRLLADTIGGDPAVCEISRLLRLPGTHNTKNQGWREVKVIEVNDLRYELDDLEEWLSETSPIIKRKDQVEAILNRVKKETNPFLLLADAQGYKPSIDVVARLEAMTYQGGGEYSIHQTQLQCIASLLTRGSDLDEAVSYLIQATREVAGAAGVNWNWGREERAIRKMGTDWLRKNPVQRELATTVLPILRGEAPPIVPSSGEIFLGGAVLPGIGGSITTPEINSGTPVDVPETVATVTPTASAAVLNLAQKREQIKGKGQGPGQPSASIKLALAGAPIAADPFIMIAKGVVDEMRLEGRDILCTEGDIFLYEEGIWESSTPADEQWLKSRIQYGFQALNVPPKVQVATAAWKHLTESPDHTRRRVPWAKTDHVVLANGVLSIKDGQFCPHSPSFYARRKMGVEYHPDAKCPKFIEFMTNIFANQDEEEKFKVVAMLQEFFGACLVPGALDREQRKALIVHGASRTGKTSISHIIAAMIGKGVTAAGLKSTSGDFGLQPIYGASAWISDDALQEGTPLDPSVFNCLVTGEPINIQIKGKPTVRGYRFDGPIVLTTNALPRVRDQTAAVYNRSLIVECSKEFTEEEAVVYRRSLGMTGGQTTGEFFVATEGPGILNWALEGLGRLRERGMYDIPDSVREATETFRNENNQVLEWARMAVEKSPGSKVSRADLLCSFHGFQKESDGEEARAMGARGFFPRFRSAISGVDLKVWDKHGRYVGGVCLTEHGLTIWNSHRLGQQLRGGSSGSSSSKGDVNKVWDKTRDTLVPVKEDKPCLFPEENK